MGLAGDRQACQSPMLFLPPGELNGTGHKFEIMNCLASPGGREGAGIGGAKAPSSGTTQTGDKIGRSQRGGHGQRGLVARRRGAFVDAAGRQKSGGFDGGKWGAVSFSVQKPLSLAS